MSLVEATITAFPSQFPTNPWFVDTYWSENLPRVRMIATDAIRLFANPSSVEVLDVGCGYGHCSVLLAMMGFRVTGTDATEDLSRERVFQRHGVRFFRSNLNSPQVLSDATKVGYDLVLLGEVFEHILNHPLGLLQRIASVLKPGGWLILTTPNPSTIMNAVRVLLDRHSLWGTADFAEHPKIVQGEVICNGDIHYREYRSSEVVRLLSLAGLRPTAVRYLASGPAISQPLFKRLLPRYPLMRLLGRSRVFGSGQYLLATRDDNSPV